MWRSVCLEEANESIVLLFCYDSLRLNHKFVCHEILAQLSYAPLNRTGGLRIFLVESRRERVDLLVEFFDCSCALCGHYRRHS